MIDRVKKPETKPADQMRVTTLAETSDSAELQSVRKRYSIDTLGDVFQGDYDSTTENKNPGKIVQPMYDPSTLYYVASTTPVMPLVDAMQTNIEKTGHTITQAEAELQATDAQLESCERAKALFNSPYPGISMIDIRKEIRADLEIAGYSGLRVIRNLGGDIAFLKHVPARNLRVIKSKKEHTENTTVERDPLPPAELAVVRRRFVVMSGTSKQYLREFGAVTQLNRKTGDWAANDTAVAPEDQADDLIFFTLKSIPGSPYGAPRWLSAIINALGARDADEQNLELLKSGGVPHTLITLVGGMLNENSRQQLENHFSSTGNKRGRVAVVEVANIGGTLDGKETPARVEVSKFGSADLNDAMFEKYIKYCTAAVQHAFRLGGVFLGMVADANRSNSEAQYLAGEQQVFRPERQDFDARIDSTIMAEIAPDYRYRSNALTYAATESKLEALGLISETADPASLAQEINTIASTNVQISEAAAAAGSQAAAEADASNDTGTAPAEPADTDDDTTVTKAATSAELDANTEALLSGFLTGSMTEAVTKALDDENAVQAAIVNLYECQPDAAEYDDVRRLFLKQLGL